MDPDSSGQLQGAANMDPVGVEGPCWQTHDFPLTVYLRLFHEDRKQLMQQNSDATIKFPHARACYSTVTSAVKYRRCVSTISFCYSLQNFSANR